MGRTQTNKFSCWNLAEITSYKKRFTFYMHYSHIITHMRGFFILIALLSLQHVLPFTCITEQRFTFYMYNIRGYFSDMHDFFKITLQRVKKTSLQQFLPFARSCLMIFELLLFSKSNYGSKHQTANLLSRFGLKIQTEIISLRFAVYC